MQTRRCLTAFGWCWLAGLLVVGNGGFFVYGQVPFPRPFQEAVSIPVDDSAAKTLLTVSDRWAMGRWREALDDLIALSESQGESLVRVDRGEEVGASRYQRVSAACEFWLATLPPEGLQRYRERIDPATESLWTAWVESGSQDSLERLVERAFFSSRGDDALWVLGQAAWKRGELSVARDWWHQLLPPAVNWPGADGRRYPDPSYPAADVAARLVLCELLLDPAQGTERLELHRRTFPESRGRLGAREGDWAELLQEFRDSNTPRHWEQQQNDIATYGGDPKRTAVSISPVDLGAELWSVSLPTIPIPRVPAVRLHPPHLPLSCYPAVEKDVVYLNDGVRIWAWSLYSGKPVWDAGESSPGMIYPTLAPDEILPPRRPVAGSPLWTVTVGAGRLFANVGSVVTTPSPLELRDQSIDLICLDIAQGEGKLLWKISGGELSSRIPIENDDAPPWNWEGTPIVRGTRLFAALSRRRPQLEWSIACLDAETGQLLWHRPVGMSRPTPPEAENLSTHLLLTADATRLYLSTHWGALAALDIRDGRMQWAITYRSEPWPERLASRNDLAICSPCIVADKSVVWAPLDSPYVMSVDARTGKLQWRSPVPDRIQHLLHQPGGPLLATGASAWGLDPSTGDTIWGIEPIEPELQGYGRGWIAGGQLLWPSRETLLAIDLDSGAVLREQPLLTPERARFGGHVLVAGSIVLVASGDRLTAYGQYSQLRESLEGFLGEAGDFHPRIRWQLAELATTQQDWASAESQWSRCASENSPELSHSTVWQVFSRRRLIEQELAGSDPLSTPVEQRLARARRWANTAELLRYVGRRELSLATDPAAQIRAWIEWLQAGASSSSRSLPDDPTRWEAARELQALRAQHGDAVLARYDQMAAARQRDLLQRDWPDVESIVAGEFPGAKLVPASARDMLNSAERGDAKEAEAIPRVTTFPPSPVWRKSWQREFTENVQLFFPHLDPTATQPLFLQWSTGKIQGCQRATGACDWSLNLLAPPQWSEQLADVLYLVTTQETVGILVPQGQVLWRRPHGTGDGEERGESIDIVRCAIPTGLLECDPLRFLRLLDSQTGDVRWQRSLLYRPWFASVHMGADRITGQEREGYHPVMLDSATGQRLPVSWPVKRPWLRPPVFSNSGEEFVTVDDQRTITAWSISGLENWRYAGLDRHAHHDPLVLCHRDQYRILVDGLQLVMMGESGRPQRSVPLLSTPLPQLTGNVLVVGDVLLVGDRGRLLGIEWERGNLIWQRTLPGAKFLQINPLGSACDLAVLTYHANHDAQATVEIWDVAVGRPVQTLVRNAAISQRFLVDSQAENVVVASREDLSVWAQSTVPADPLMLK